MKMCGKGLPIELRSCEYVGMAKVEKSFRRYLKTYGGNDSKPAA